MDTKLRTIFAAPGGSWGDLFTQEERDREIEKFKGKLNEVRPLLPNVEVSIGDARRLLRTFSGGLHRVLAYGDHVEQIESLCRLLGIEVASEVSPFVSG